MRVLLYGLIFALSVLGNALVVAVLALNRRLRTVTNAFLLSLALSDLLLALCCMPFTLIPNLMGTFVFGDVVCKLMAYLMGECLPCWGHCWGKFVSWGGAGALPQEDHSGEWAGGSLQGGAEALLGEAHITG